jgi:hypothetical protein
MARESDRDVREEVGISLFWRELIGDYEYGRFDPDDMIRWYDALTLRGPLEIRDLIDERYTGRPGSSVRGIVSGAPHPPVWLVREWLAHFENKVRTGGYWMAAAGFVLFCGIVFPIVSGVTQLTPLSTYAMHPPFGGPQVTPATQPPNYSLPSSSLTPPAVSSPGPTGPSSAGIAGVATGASPAGGTTGAANVGLSAGVISPAPAVGNTQP